MKRISGELLKIAVIYGRRKRNVSGREEYGKEIPEQLDFLRWYAKKMNFLVVKEFVDNNSLNYTDRPNFKIMVNFLESHKDTTIVLAENANLLFLEEEEHEKLYGMGLELHFPGDDYVVGKKFFNKNKKWQGHEIHFALACNHDIALRIDNDNYVTIGSKEEKPAGTKS